MTKKSYVAPTIERKIAGMPSKPTIEGLISYQDNINGVSVKELLEKYGSPLFVLSEKSIRRKYKEAYRAFSLQYPKVKFAWSYKTNYLNAVCSVFHQEGALAEVVSGMEYDRARILGIPGKNIIFNGPAKTEKELLKAVKENAIINIDHRDELFLLESIAEKIGKSPQIGIRVNMDAGVYPLWTRFGFNYENREAYRVIQRLQNGGKLDLIGLHTHIGTFILEPNAYYIAASKLLKLAEDIEEDFGVRIGFIDLGGGFASSNTLHQQYLPGEYSSPSLDQYAEAVGRAFNESPFCRKEQPTLFLETGRALIDEAGYLVSSVVGKKTLADGRKALIIDAGVNMLYTSNWYKHKIVPAQPITGTMEETVIYGPLCMNIDVIRYGIRLPDLKVGDKVIIKSVGAYNVTQWMQFITYRPNVVLIAENGDIDLIREAENLNDIVSKERLPERLKLKK